MCSIFLTKEELKKIAFEDALIKGYCNLDDFRQNQIMLKQGITVTTSKEEPNTYIAIIRFQLLNQERKHKIESSSYKELLQKCYNFLYEYK